MTLTYELDIDKLDDLQCQISRWIVFHSKVIVRTHRHTYTADRPRYPYHKVVSKTN